MPLAPHQKPNAEFTPLAEKPTVRFHDIAGLEDSKHEVRLRMILPALHPEKAWLYGIRQGGGILLYGPPGTGKTMLAKAIATEVDAAFYHVRPSDIMSGQVGQTEANVDRLFRTLRCDKRAVLFIDEVEALLPSRRRNGSTIMQRVISQLLGEIDGILETPAGHVLLLIGATNEPGMIDPAMLRPGRFDSLVYCGLPDAAARRKILTSNLTGRPTSQDVNIEELASKTEGLSGAELRELVNRAADRAFLDSVRGSGERPVAADDFVDALTAIRRAGHGFRRESPPTESKYLVSSGLVPRSRPGPPAHHC